MVSKIRDINSRFLIIVLTILCMLIFLETWVHANDSIEDIKFTGVVNANTLNLRNGPGLDYEIITMLKKDDTVNVIGKINNWYIVQTSKNLFGLCNTKYIEDTGEDSIQRAVLNSINEKREKSKIKKLILDNKLSEIAKLKAQDIIDNNYFSHDSKELGTPFDMLNKYDVKFMTVGESIAKSNDVNEFIDLVVKSESYKQNSLSNDYNYTGISILPIDEYNYIYVQLFVGRQ